MSLIVIGVTIYMYMYINYDNILLLSVAYNYTCMNIILHSSTVYTICT